MSPSMSNLTYAVQNANETLYGPPHVIPPMFTNVSPTNSNMQMQLGPQMQTKHFSVYSVRLSVSKFPSSRKFSAPIVVKHTNKTTTDQSYKTGDQTSKQFGEFITR
jgi:hypothetical protein